MNSSLIGLRVNITQSDSGIDSYELDDALMESRIRSMHNPVRIFTPDTIGTADYDPERTNVYVDKDGYITQVSNG